jgi:tetratricopeptide (TPR) repeat protein
MFRRRCCARNWLPCVAIASALGAFAINAAATLADDRDIRTEAASTTDAEKSPPKSSAARISELIRQLGSPQFTIRRMAATELHKIGPEAFDQLHAATENADPEIAASARYLLRQITVRWTRPDDSAAVRRLLRNFNDQGDSERQSIIQALSALDDRDGIAGLCRIARFDRSPRLSRLAALAAMRSVERSNSSEELDPSIVDRELGESTRVATEWLRQFELQVRDPAASVPGWQTLLDEESRRLDANLDETSPAIVLALLWNLADVHRGLGQNDALVAAADRILATSGDNSDLMLSKFLQWLVDNEAWQGLDLFAVKYDDRIRQTKPSLYLLALARAKQNQSALADQLALEASQLGNRATSDQIEAFAEQLNLAQLLVGWGQFDWAVREYRQGFEDKPVDSDESIAGRVLLSNLLQDYERFKESADVIEPIAKALEKNRELQRPYNNLQAELAQYDVYLIGPEAVGARQHFMLASHYEREGDYARQREELLKAIDCDPKDADVLIAMHRAPETDDAWKTDTRERIEKLARSIEREIDDDPNNPIPYNQWAWLIANTEGDYAKAVRFSRRSLELYPNSPSFLDTLGRCYYAAGDLRKAIRYQRRAVDQIPHMQVMQRQLKLFESKLAEQDAKNDQ